jgi:peptide/nickel transport system permease protein
MVIAPPVALPRGPREVALVQRRPFGWLAGARQRPLGALALALIVSLALIAVFAGGLAPHDPTRIYPGTRLAEPGSLAPNRVPFLLGADESGRDLLSRLIFGARISLEVGLLSVGMATLLGTTIGLLSAFRAGKTDLILQRLMDSQQAIPSLVLALLLMAILGSSLVNVILAIGLVQIPYTNRVVRSAVLGLKQEIYIEAARVIGASDARIMLRHVLPNVLPPIIVVATSGLGGAILTEAYLSFLGLGTPPPTPSWGAMISGARTYMLTEPRLLIAPAAVLSLTVLGWNLAGDALRDVLDPNMRKRV